MDNPTYSPPPETPMTPPPAPAPMPAAAPSNNRGWMAITSLVLGIINFCGMFIPCCGAVLPIVGLILGILGLNSSRRGMAIAGIVLSVITLCASIALSAIYGPRLWNQFRYQY